MAVVTITKGSFRNIPPVGGLTTPRPPSRKPLPPMTRRYEVPSPPAGFFIWYNVADSKINLRDSDEKTFHTNVRGINYRWFGVAGMGGA